MKLFIAQDFKNRKRWQRQQTKTLRPTLSAVFNVMKPLVRYTVHDIMNKTGLSRAVVYPRLTELDRKFLITKHSEEEERTESFVYYVRNI